MNPSLKKILTAYRTTQKIMMHIGCRGKHHGGF